MNEEFKETDCPKFQNNFLHVNKIMSWNKNVINNVIKEFSKHVENMNGTWQ